MAAFGTYPYTMLKLRDAAGKAIGCNLDPSHLWWQGIDPVAAVKILGKPMRSITSMPKIRIWTKTISTCMA